MKLFKIITYSILMPGLLFFKQDTKTPYKKIDNKTIYSVESKNVYIFTSRMKIDADGAPKAYHKDPDKGLDYLRYAGKPGNWWALATDNKASNGNPLIQKPSDPAPGYYISTTALVDGSKRYEDPNRYVNSETVPYIVIPKYFAGDFKKGDIALVINKNNNKRCYAITADVGDKDKIGEGSIYLALQLGINSSPKNGGGNNIVFILFKNSGNGKVMSNEKITAIGTAKLTKDEIAELTNN